MPGKSSELGILIVGHVYKSSKIEGKNIVFRAMNWDDTDKLLIFINRLFDEKRKGKYLDVFTGFEQKVSRTEEASWLAERIVEIENGDLIGVLAEVGNKVVANGEIARGRYDETRHHGRLAITVLAAYRGLGIGREMVKVLLREARRVSLKNVEVEFLSTNQAAVHTYQKAGFMKVGSIPGKLRRKGKLIDSTIMARRV